MLKNLQNTVKTTGTSFPDLKHGANGASTLSVESSRQDMKKAFSWAAVRKTLNYSKRLEKEVLAHMRRIRSHVCPLLIGYKKGAVDSEII